MNKRKALIIGNSNYQVKPLKNPINDANSISEILYDKGFDVTRKINLDSNSLFFAVNDFCNEVDQHNEVVLFYFSGHGLESSGNNYLIPCDFNGDSTLQYHAPNLDFIIDSFSKSFPNSAKLFILDACRNDGDKDFIESLTSKGCANFNAVNLGQAKPTTKNSNTLIAFSTAPGMKASDGDANSRNGLYTKYLIESISRYNLSIEEVFRLVREQVIAGSDFKQIPWEYSSLLKPFSFDYYDVPHTLVDTITLPFDTLFSSQFIPGKTSVALVGNSNLLLIQTVNGYENSAHEIGVSSIQGEVVCVTKRYYLVGTSEGYLYCYDTLEKTKKSIHIFDSGFYAMSISPNSNEVLLCGDEGALRCLSIDDLRIFSVIDTGIKNIFSISHTIDGNSVLLCGDNSELIIYDTTNYQLVKKLDNDSSYSNAASFSPDGKFLATGHDRGIVKIWETGNYKLLKTVYLSEYVENIVTNIEVMKDSGEIPTNHIVSLCFTPDSNVLIIGTSNPSLAFIDVKYNQLIKEIELDFSVSQVYSLSISDCGGYLVCSGHKRNAYVFSTSKAIKSDSLQLASSHS